MFAVFNVNDRKTKRLKFRFLSPRFELARILTSSNLSYIGEWYRFVFEFLIRPGYGQWNNFYTQNALIILRKNSLVFTGYFCYFDSSLKCRNERFLVVHLLKTFSVKLSAEIYNDDN